MSYEITIITKRVVHSPEELMDYCHYLQSVGIPARVCGELWKNNHIVYETADARTEFFVEEK